MADGCLRRGVFIDRDGTINEEVPYLHRVEDFRFISGAEQALLMLKRAGFVVVVVTNQSGIARGYYDESALHLLHAHVDASLHLHGAVVDRYYFCPHQGTEGTGRTAAPCDCRKPLPGMLLRAAEELGISLSRSFMIGDRVIDVEAGLRAGCTPILVRTGYGADEEKTLPGLVTVVDSIVEAAEFIVNTARSED